MMHLTFLLQVNNWIMFPLERLTTDRLRQWRQASDDRGRLRRELVFWPPALRRRFTLAVCSSSSSCSRYGDSLSSLMASIESCSLMPDVPRHQLRHRRSFPPTGRHGFFHLQRTYPRGVRLLGSGLAPCVFGGPLPRKAVDGLEL